MTASWRESFAGHKSGGYLSCRVSEVIGTSATAGRWRFPLGTGQGSSVLATIWVGHFWGMTAKKGSSPCRKGGVISEENFAELGE